MTGKDLERLAQKEKNWAKSGFSSKLDVDRELGSSSTSHILWQVFPRFQRTTGKLAEVVKVFQKNEHNFIETTKPPKAGEEEKSGLTSDDVLKILRDDLKAIGFKVEKSKKEQDKITLAVTYGQNDETEKAFEVDAYHVAEEIMLEVEAGRAVANNAAYFDLLKGCALQGVSHVIIAVRLKYKRNPDFDNVCKTFDTLYASSRITFPIKSLLIIGYPVFTSSRGRKAGR